MHKEIGFRLNLESFEKKIKSNIQALIEEDLDSKNNPNVLYNT